NKGFFYRSYVEHDVPDLASIQGFFRHLFRAHNSKINYSVNLLGLRRLYLISYARIYLIKFTNILDNTFSKIPINDGKVANHATIRVIIRIEKQGSKIFVNASRRPGQGRDNAF